MTSSDPYEIAVFTNARVTDTSTAFTAFWPLMAAPGCNTIERHACERPPVCRLMSLQYTLLQQEADLRFALVRVREHCEAIAFFRGHAAEAAHSGAAFADVVRTRRVAITWTALLAVWRNLYTYSTLLVPSLITAPQYFAGLVQFGVVTQVRPHPPCPSMTPEFVYHLVFGTSSARSPVRLLFAAMRVRFHGHV